MVPSTKRKPKFTSKSWYSFSVHSTEPFFLGPLLNFRMLSVTWYHFDTSLPWGTFHPLSPFLFKRSDDFLGISFFAKSEEEKRHKTVRTHIFDRLFLFMNFKSLIVLIWDMVKPMDPSSNVPFSDKDITLGE